MPIVFSSIIPHPPILLPEIGTVQDKKQVEKTIQSLFFLAEKFKKQKPDLIIISSPHSDWGFNVPLFFLAKNFKGKIEKILIESESPEFYFNKGKKISNDFNFHRLALISSGDLSHCLKKNGPYGFHPHGPEFDKELIECLKKKDIQNILKLNEKYPQAAQCGLSSFCFVLGIMESSGINYQPEILSYQSPFGVGYLVVNFKI